MSGPHYDNVYWIGGSFSGGKSTTARLLSQEFNLSLYHYDRQLLTDPAFAAFKGEGRQWFWLPNEEKFSRYRQTFPIALDQLRQCARCGPVITEGPGWLPELLASLPVKPGRVVYLLPTPEFQRWANRQRGQWVDDVLATKPEPQSAWEEWMRIDEQFANHVEESASDHGFRVIRVNATLPPERLVREVSDHFGLTSYGARRSRNCAR
jgi:hypothetical protein